MSETKKNMWPCEVCGETTEDTFDTTSLTKTGFVHNKCISSEAVLAERLSVEQALRFINMVGRRFVS